MGEGMHAFRKTRPVAGSFSCPCSGEGPSGSLPLCKEKERRRFHGKFPGQGKGTIIKDGLLCMIPTICEMLMPYVRTVNHAGIAPDFLSS
jgi:hypothetical protein